MNTHFFAALASVVLVGCATTPFTEVQERASWTSQGKTAITEPIGLLADTQFHESRGVPSRSIGRAGDEFVDVTVRTGQQVIGAGDVLRHAFERSKQFGLVLHAGDALDVSCETEWWLFNLVTAESRGQPGPRSWLFTPGNHDGFHTGNIFPDDASVYVESYWTNMCNAGRLCKKDAMGRMIQKHAHMPKDQIVSQYLKMLEPLKVTSESQGGCDSGGSLCWSSRISASAPWTSFVVQRVRLPSPVDTATPVYAVLLDTSDHARRPDVLSFNSYAGIRGEMSKRQLDAAYELVSNLPAGARYFFVSHHPASDWRSANWPDATRAAWNRLLTDPRSLRFLVSAHTHEGSLRKYVEDIGVLTELNLGSLADAPIYIRSLVFERDSEGTIGFRSKGIPLLAKQVCSADWAEKAKNRDKLLDYGVDGQRSESDRASTWPAPLRGISAFFGALGHVLSFWSAKHEELRPQLLAYADVVEDSMPADAPITYVGTTTSGPDIEHSLKGNREVARALRTLANCKPDQKLDDDAGAKYCTVQAKGNLLRALDEYYWGSDGAPRAVKDRAHRLRLCLALSAAEESPSARGRPRVEQLMQQVESEWSSQLR